MSHQRNQSPPVDRSAFAGYRFPPEVIMLAVRWYLRYGLSYRDVEELFVERGIEVDHVTIHRWVQRFTPLLIDAARPRRHAVGRRWFVDETYVKVAGTWRYVYRAVDEHGQVIDVFVSRRRDLVAARRFFVERSTLTVNRTKSSPISLKPSRLSSKNSSPRRFTTPSNTPTIASSAITADSNRGSDQCAASKPIGQHQS